LFPGFFRSISLRDDNTLQDSLRLLTLWFKFGFEERVTLAVNEGASMVSVDTWLEVVPQASFSVFNPSCSNLAIQLIARIQTPIATVRVTINTLLTEVGKAHPQSLIYPLTVASKSSNDLRRKTAKMVMERLKEHSSSLVEQASPILIGIWIGPYSHEVTHSQQ
jgi:FKBP12-rapamycin complex-associated protein